MSVTAGLYHMADGGLPRLPEGKVTTHFHNVFVGSHHTQNEIAEGRVCALFPEVWGICANRLGIYSMRDSLSSLYFIDIRMKTDIYYFYFQL